MHEIPELWGRERHGRKERSGTEIFWRVHREGICLSVGHWNVYKQQTPGPVSKVRHPEVSDWLKEEPGFKCDFKSNIDTKIWQLYKVFNQICAEFI